MPDLSDLDPNKDSHEPRLITKSKYYTSDEFISFNESISIANYLTILNVNSRSLAKHHTEYALYLKSLESNTFTSFDILSFTETWLDDHLQQLAFFNDYQSVFKHKVGQKEGGGLAIFIRNNIYFFSVKI